jgi:hypothetical protein
MAEIAKGSTLPSISTPWPAKENLLTGLLAGENIAQGDACYIASSGSAMRANGSAANAAAKVFGFASKASDNGEAVTLARHINMGYGPNVAGTPTVPGTDLFLSGTVPGGLADAASTGGTVPIAVVLDTDGRIYLKTNY